MLDTTPGSLQADMPHADLGPLAWVFEELRKSLESANKAIKRFVRESEASRQSEDLEAVDPSSLRMARQQLHQSVGALEMVGLGAPAQVVRAMEAAVGRFVQKPQSCDDAAAEKVEKASFALIEYLEATLNNKKVHPAALFAQYKDVQEVAGAERVHPADLWPFEQRSFEVAAPESKSPLQPDAKLRALFDRLVLLVIKTASPAGAQQLVRVSANLSAGAATPRVASFWRVAAAYFEALGAGLLPADVYVKRAASRILLQFASFVQGQNQVSETLMHDLLFFCSLAGPKDASTPHLAAVREAYGLRTETVDYTKATLGRYDPAVLAQARKRINSAKESWSLFSGGDRTRARQVLDQFGLIGESLLKLHAGSTRLSRSLVKAVDQSVKSESGVRPELSMEVATTTLYLEAVFEDFDPNDKELTARTDGLAERLEEVIAGHPAKPLEPWMEQLYRRVSDRQTMGSVVDELKVSLAEAEKSLDQFFRSPAEKAGLHVAVSQLQQMKGVLSVLGLDQAVNTVNHMSQVVESIILDESSDQLEARTEQLGGNLSALSFLVDMLSYQPALAKKLFAFDESTGELKALMGRVSNAATPHQLANADAKAISDGVRKVVSDVEEGSDLGFVSSQLDSLAEQASLAEQPAVAKAARDASAALVHQDASAGAAALVGLSQASAPKAAPEPVSAPAADDDDEDDLLDIFLEEAREVVVNGKEAIAALRNQLDDLDNMTTLRRSFHTLKGSSRMVGLEEFGEAAWALEQVLNEALAEQKPAHVGMLDVSDEAMTAFGQWVEDVAAKQADGWRSKPFKESAKAWRERSEVIPLTFDENISSRLSELADLPSQPAPLVTDIDLGALADVSETVEAAPVRDITEEAIAPSIFDDISLDLDLPDVPQGAEDAGTESAPASLSGELPDIDLSQPMPLEDSVDSGLGIDLDLGALPDLPEVKGFEITRPFEDAIPEADIEITEDMLPSLDSAEVVELGGEGPDAASPTRVEESAKDEPPAEGVVDASSATPAEEHAPIIVDNDLADDQVKVIGPLRVGIKLYNVYLNEADEWSRKLNDRLTEWSLERHEALPSQAEALAHSLAGSSATVGFKPLSEISRALEHALEAVKLFQEDGHQVSESLATTFVEASEEIRRLLHQFAAGFYKDFSPELMEKLQSIVHSPAQVVGEAGETTEAASETSTSEGADGVEVETVVVSVSDGQADVEVVEAVLPESTDEGEPQGEPEVQPEEVVSASAEAEGHGEHGDVQAPVAPEEPLLPEGVVAASALGEVSPVLASLPSAKNAGVAQDVDDDIDEVDMVDADLFPIFEEEALELLPQLGAALRQWRSRPQDSSARSEVLRHLHTLKGSARLAGALRLGEMVHRMETDAERLGSDVQDGDLIEPLQATFDGIEARFESLRDPAEQAESMVQVAPEQGVPPVESPTVTVNTDAEIDVVDAAEESAESAEPTSTVSAPATGGLQGLELPKAPAQIQTKAGAAVRVRPELLDRMMMQAGEVMISRSRMEGELVALRGSLKDLTGNLDRLRQQLRDVELQAETQMQSRLAQAKDSNLAFDPLEFDRFTRVQELTRMMAESVNDVATVQRNLQRAVESTEDSLVAQARQTRELQGDLLRTRMVEFEGISERLYRVVRQTSKETGKQVRLDITGGNIEMDRGVLDRMTAAFEHLLRNCVVHGIESPGRREIVGKPAEGQINIRLHQELNDVSVVFEDDGAGVNLERLKAKAVEQGLIDTSAKLSDDEAAQLMFLSGMSTADEVSSLAGRGVGMDVVRNDVIALGGRIETHTEAGKGTSFKLVLPLTTAVTQVVMVRAGNLTFGVPSNLVQVVRRVTADDLAVAYRSGFMDVEGDSVPFHWAGALLQSSAQSQEMAGRTLPVIVFRSAAQRASVHVDEVLGNQEVVVKNLGPQLSRLPGLAGMTILASGAVALIYNPVALATVYGEQARQWVKETLERAEQAAASAAASGDGADQIELPEAMVPSVPLVLVVDDSITVRRVTQRLLKREGYRVSLAADGLQALERLQEERPTVVLSDIEMPRMDGFDLVRNIRADSALADLPVIMITSRIAEKHREHARELGVDHYLGKPYSEDELLSLIAHYVKESAES